MIDKSKTYKTRDGREVRIYATDGVLPYPIHGAIKTKEGWVRASWTPDGDEGLRSDDLIEVRPRHKRTVWLNVYDNEWVSAFSSKQKGLKTLCGDEKLIACIKVELDFEEGEGL
jgi:hypothetical protein